MSIEVKLSTDSETEYIKEFVNKLNLGFSIKSYTDAFVAIVNYAESLDQKEDIFSIDLRVNKEDFKLYFSRRGIRYFRDFCPYSIFRHLDEFYKAIQDKETLNEYLERNKGFPLFSYNGI